MEFLIPKAKKVIYNVIVTELYTNVPVSLSILENDCRFIYDPRTELH